MNPVTAILSPFHPRWHSLLLAVLLGSAAAPLLAAAPAGTLPPLPGDTPPGGTELQPANAAPLLHTPLRQLAEAPRARRGTRRAHARRAVDGGTVTLAAGAGRLLRLATPAATVFVADPTIADIQVPTANAVFVLGKKAGTTTVYALDAQGAPILERSVVVGHNLAELRAILAQRFPGLHLDLKSAPGSLMVSGTVNNPQDITAITQTLQSYLVNKETLVNRLAVGSPTQVNLRVRIAEVQRTVLQQIGVNWWALGDKGGLLSGRQVYDATSTPPAWNLPSNSGFMAIIGSKSHGGVVDMLDRESLMTTLAEPNLTTVSGETASFLAGGEYPIPVAQSSNTGSNTITVQYKDFGVGLNFTPTVLTGDRINLKVRPEVSQLDSNNSVTTGGITIPGLSVRRVETTVELASGQSFVIGGLLQNNVRDVLSQMPGLGRLPILGRLFSSTDYQNDKSELVVIVTPYLVRPVGPGQLQTPLDSLRRPSDVERVLQRQARFDPYDAQTPRLAGQAGFVY